MDGRFYRFYLYKPAIEIEYCYYVQCTSELQPHQLIVLEHIICADTEKFNTVSFFSDALVTQGKVVERGPKLRHQSEWGTKIDITQVRATYSCQN